MLKKVWMYSIVGALALALVGGSIYLIVRPSDVQAERGWENESLATQGDGYRGRQEDVDPFNEEDCVTSGQGGGYGRQQDEISRGRGNVDSGTGQGVGSGGVGRGQAEALDNGTNGGSDIMRGQGAGQAGQGARSTGRGASGGQGVNMPDAVPPADWDVIEGTVTVSDSEITVQTDAGEILVGMGQSWYREDAGFVVEVGDEVRVSGYEEDGEFKAGTVENLTTGESITLRDMSGRPMWAGRGNLQNHP